MALPPLPVFRSRAAIPVNPSSSAIARRLVVSEGTIRLELTAIFRKLGVANRLQAALLVSQS